MTGDGPRVRKRRRVPESGARELWRGNIDRVRLGDDPVGHQHHVPRRLAARVAARHHGQVEAERVLGRPPHLQQRLLVQVVHQAARSGQAYGLAQCRVRRSDAVRLRVFGLLEDDHIPGAQLERPLRAVALAVRRRVALAVRRRAVDQHGAGRARGEVAVALAPAPQPDRVVGLPQLRDRFQTMRAGLGRQRGVLREGGQRVGRQRARVEHHRPVVHPVARRREPDSTERNYTERSRQADPSPGVASLVQAVVDQARVSSHRDRWRAVIR